MTRWWTGWGGWRGAGVRVLALLALCLPATATRAASEDEIKAALLSKFGPYIVWPTGREPSGTQAFVIGLLGEVSFAPLLESRAEEESGRGNTMQVRRLRSVNEAAGVHLLFVSAALGEEETRLLAALGHCACLLVGESERFLESGGMVRLVLENKRVRFDVNVAAAERAGLKISAKMLKHARSVRGGSR